MSDEGHRARMDSEEVALKFSTDHPTSRLANELTCNTRSSRSDMIHSPIAQSPIYIHSGLSDLLIHDIFDPTTIALAQTGPLFTHLIPDG